MENYFILILLLFFPVSLQTSVIELSDQDFAERTNTGQWFVEFYAPWCGHCQALAPTWETFASIPTKPFHVAKVDCTVNNKACFGVYGYPFIALFVDGVKYDYSGGRNVDEFVKFYNGKTGGSVTLDAGGVTKNDEEEKTEVTILTPENYEQQTKEGTVIVEFYSPWCDNCKILAPIWEKLAVQQKDNFKTAKVNCVDHLEFCNEHGVITLPTIKLYIDGVEGPFKGQRTLTAIVNFIESERKAAVEGIRVGKPKFQMSGPSNVVILTEENFKAKTKTGTSLVVFCIESVGFCKRIFPELEELASTKKNFVTVGRVDCQNQEEFCKSHGANAYPTVKIFFDGKGTMYHGPQNALSMTGFVQNMQSYYERVKREETEKRAADKAKQEKKEEL